MRRLRKGSCRQLVCIPFAGGAAHVYHALADAMDDGWEVIGIDPPGHGAAPGPPPDDFDELAAACEEAVVRVARRPYVLFGHSLGGLVAYRVARRLAAAPFAPDAVVLSGCVPPEHDVRTPHSTASDAELLRYLAGSGATAAELLASAEFVGYVLPILRSGLRAVETFTEPDRSSLGIPALLLAGTDDPDAPLAAVREWRRAFLHADVAEVEGGHMFVVFNPTGTAAALRRWDAGVQPR